MDTDIIIGRIEALRGRAIQELITYKPLDLPLPKDFTTAYKIIATWPSFLQRHTALRTPAKLKAHLHTLIDL
jgi:hypothetical protein